VPNVARATQEPYPIRSLWAKFHGAGIRGFGPSSLSIVFKSILSSVQDCGHPIAPLSSGEALLPERCAPLSQVVALLNPLAGVAMQRELEEQIAGMQQELSQAHQQVGGPETARNAC
jgi:hypothetical protein